MKHAFLKKSLLLLLLAALLVPSLASCKSDKKDPVDAEVTYDLENLVAHDVVTVPKQNWGITAFKATTTEPGVASAVLNDDGSVTITSYNPGKADILVADCFDHAATIHVTAAKNDDCTISYDFEKFSGTFINARSFGCIPNTGADCTTALQKAIDKAAETKTSVYLFPGIYKVSFLHIRDGVTLEMYSGVEDATKGYTPELAKAVNDGTVTVLKQTRIMNNDMYAYGHDGDSNFTIRGGVIDNEGSSQSILLFGLADNIRLENVVFKDIKCNHVIQFTGCSNIVVDNCMFAGFIDGGTFTREVIQFEPTTPGAHGAGANPPQRFYDGEAIGNDNIKITNTYFGPSDEEGPPLIAIGHHGRTRDANCDTLLIDNCVFEGCMYAGIRISNIVDAQISNCTFKTGSISNPYYKEQKTPAHIMIFSYNNTITYTALNSSTTCTTSLPQELSGTHNLKIINNKFTLTPGTDKRVFEFSGTTNSYGLFYQSSGIMRQDTYDGPIYKLSGYLPSDNVIEGVTISGNEINVEGKLAYTNYIANFANVRGLFISDNTLNIADGVTFTSSDMGLKGFKIASSCVTDPIEALTRTVNVAKSSKNVTINTSTGGTFLMNANATYRVDFKVTEGGHVETSSEKGSNAKVTAIPDEGYEFIGWFDKDDKKVDTDGSTLTVTAVKTLTAKFRKAQ